MEANKTYKVAGWASVSQEVQNAGGEPIWDVMAAYLRSVKTVNIQHLNMPDIKGLAENPGYAKV